MKNGFRADCLPILIGSLPLGDHEKALRMVLAYTPEIPLWVQLPVYREEGMIAQFVPGLPGIVQSEERLYVDTAGEEFDASLLAFYEEYMAAAGGEIELNNSRFALTPDTARGFFVFLEHITKRGEKPVAVKGQITGPVTFTTSVTDVHKTAIFYDGQLRDAAVKLLALKARWQARQLSKCGCPAMVFLDEPALAGYGSSEFTSVSREDITAGLEEVIEGIHAEGAMAGIHVCANTDWSLVLETSADIVSFDAYSYFDRFILYFDSVRKFIESGRILAWGIVPTLKVEEIENAQGPALVKQVMAGMQALADRGIDRGRLLAQSLISPSCGAGSLSLGHATRVLSLTREVSESIRKENPVLTAT